MRGDVELLRYQLGNEGYEMAKKSAGVLLKNAEKYYRGASAVARSTGSVEESDEGIMKEYLAKALGGDREGLVEAWKVDRVRLQVFLEEAISEGLVGGEELAAMGIS